MRASTPAHLITHTGELVSFSGKRRAAHVENVLALYFSVVYRAAPLWSTARLEFIKGRLAAIFGGGRRKSARTSGLGECLRCLPTLPRNFGITGVRGVGANTAPHVFPLSPKLW
ncbi:hypothetical protein TRVL_09796 [Trypanosoma vivax]|nr:hypothetical protein TRVL_09796 [Trypanosoma vivax]